METKLQVEIKKLIDRYTSKSLFGMPMYHEGWIVGDLNSLLEVADAEAKEPVKVAIQQRGQIIIKNQFTGKDTVVMVDNGKFYWHEKEDLKPIVKTNEEIKEHLLGAILFERQKVSLYNSRDVNYVEVMARNGGRIEAFNSILDFVEDKKSSGFYGHIKNKKLPDIDIQTGEKNLCKQEPISDYYGYLKNKDDNSDEPQIHDYDKLLVEAYAEALKPVIEAQNSLLSSMNEGSKAWKALKLMIAPPYMNMTDAIKKVEGEL